MKMPMKRLFVVATLLVCGLTLSGCLSHWFIDSTTRLQIENQSNQTIVGIDISNEDYSENTPWIQDTIRPGEKSRVYEEDWVGTFHVRIRTEAGNYSIDELRFDGGSEYVVFTDDEDNTLHYEFK